MTREKAIEYLKKADVTVYQEPKTKTAEAIEMAIKALEQEQKSEWEHDQEILKAHSEGAREMLDIIRAEINSPNRGTCDYFIVDRIEEIINEYKAESAEIQELCEEGAEE